MKATCACTGGSWSVGAKDSKDIVKTLRHCCQRKILVVCCHGLILSLHWCQQGRDVFWILLMHLPFQQSKTFSPVKHFQFWWWKWMEMGSLTGLTGSQRCQGSDCDDAFALAGGPLDVGLWLDLPLIPMSATLINRCITKLIAIIWLEWFQSPGDLLKHPQRGNCSNWSKQLQIVCNC